MFVGLQAGCKWELEANMLFTNIEAAVPGREQCVVKRSGCVSHFLSSETERKRKAICSLSLPAPPPLRGASNSF